MTALAVQLDETTERLEAEACTLAPDRGRHVPFPVGRRRTRSARSMAGVGRAIEELPQITEAFAGGRLSFSQVRALVRIAKPEHETEFIELAAVTTASQLERIAGAYEATTRDTDTASLFRRGVRVVHEDDGSLSLRVRLTGDAGAVLLAAIDAALEQVPHDNASVDACEDPIAARRADGLELLARSYVEPDGHRAPRTRVVLHGDLQTVSDPAAGEPLRLASCDAQLELDAGRRRRTPPSALRRAIERRDEGCCRFPGCGNQRYLHAHHIVHWGHDGPTDADNLILLCTFHQRLLHTTGWRVRGRVFIDPRGRERVERVEPPPILRLAPSINAGTISTAHGGRMDLDHAITALVSRDGRRPSPN
jgi:hypothetical protein